MNPAALGRTMLEQLDDQVSNPPMNEEDRIRAVFELPSGAALPQVNKDTLVTYHEYLLGRLSFPFHALYMETTAPVRQLVRYVTVLGLSDDVRRRLYGLFCKVQIDDAVVELPLADMGLREDAPNRQLVDDYMYWLWHTCD
jgi:hypothetical protein